MGKIYASICAVTPLEQRTKKDGSGTYEYAAVDLQVYDINNRPSVHEIYDWHTGDKLSDRPDCLRFDAIREKAQQLHDMGYKVGDVVIADVDMHQNKYGYNEVTVRGVEPYQQPKSNVPFSR